MSQHDFDIANQGMPAARTDLNAALVALASNSSGSSAPSSPTTNQFWLDTAGTPYVLKIYDGTDWIVLAEVNASTNIAMPFFSRNQIGGLILSNDTDADHDIAVAVGECIDGGNTEMMVLGSILTKQIDAAWAVGDDAGGVDTGAVAADTLYAVWLIKRTDTGVVDALFSTSFTAPTMPTNYDKKRLIGAVVTDATSNIVAFTQVGDYFRYTGDIITDISDATITDATFETGTLSVPPSSLAHVYAGISNPTETGINSRIAVRTNGAADIFGGGEVWIGVTVETATEAEGAKGIGMVLVDSSSQIEYAGEETGGTATITISTIGFTMLTRSNPI